MAVTWSGRDECLTGKGAASNIRRVKLKGNGQRYRDVANLGTLGLTMVLCVGLGVGAGLWIDKRVGSSPDFTIVGLFVGAAAAFFEVLRAVRIIRRDDP